jgi:hypothetical protein
MSDRSDVAEPEIAATVCLTTSLHARNAVYHKYLSALEKKILDVCPEILTADGKCRSMCRCPLEELCKVCTTLQITLELDANVMTLDQDCKGCGDVHDMYTCHKFIDGEQCDETYMGSLHTAHRLEAELKRHEHHKPEQITGRS